MDKAQSIVDALLQKNPDFPLWRSIKNQLDFIESDFEVSGSFKSNSNIEMVRNIILGVQSIREVEQGNPELSDLLCEIDYQYKKLYGLVK
ncbi:immunity protein Tsi6 family protein [Cellvibrio sp. QJXJ]|nr:immunity protein Tsi6 family protein [Cellvibrio sp. QJXJ]